jgi:hypothetical protein
LVKLKEIESLPLNSIIGKHASKEIRLSLYSFILLLFDVDFTELNYCFLCRCRGGGAERLWYGDRIHE